MSIFNKLTEAVINELDYAGMTRKQQSVTKLFPPFQARKQKLVDNGGLVLVNQFPELWQFKVPSGTKPGVEYDVYVHFFNIVPSLKKWVPARGLWNKDETAIDYRSLAAEVLFDIDIKTDCSCPADTFWGPEYIKTQYKNKSGGVSAQFGDDEDRAPRVRNPHQYGLLCKHGAYVVEKLPMFTSTFAKWLKDFYSDDIDKMFIAAQQEWFGIQKAAGELGKAEEEQPVAFAKGGKHVELPKEVGPEEKSEEPEGGGAVGAVKPKPKPTGGAPKATSPEEEKGKTKETPKGLTKATTPANTPATKPATRKAGPETK